MSKIAVVFELPGMTSEKYDAIFTELRAQNKVPNDHRPSHVGFQKGDNWCVVDVWDSEEAMGEFVGTTLMPIFMKLGITPPQPGIYPVHRYLGRDGVEQTD